MPQSSASSVPTIAAGSLGAKCRSSEVATATPAAAPPTTQSHCHF
ncbi:MAG: hypothetical protein ACO3YY_00075 [Phycisphaerales bacterium]